MANFPRLLEEGRVEVRINSDGTHVLTEDGLDQIINHLQDAKQLLQSSHGDHRSNPPSRYGSRFVLKAALLFLLLEIFTIPVFADAVRYHSVMNSNFTTPWYDKEWWKEPYTHFRLSGHPSKVYWKTSPKGDLRQIKEIYVQDKVFWTILQEKN